jgi:hypothetical protein
LTYSCDTSARCLVIVSLALGVLVLVAVPLHAALRADPSVLDDDDYLRPACRVPFQAFPEPVCPRVVAGESPATVLYALIAVPLLARRPGQRRLLAIAVTSAAFAAVQILAPFAFTFESAFTDERPSPFQADPGCGLVNCGLDHTLFHLAQVPFFSAMALLSYWLYRATRGLFSNHCSGRSL